MDLINVSSTNLGGNQQQTPAHSDNIGSGTGLNSTQIKMKKLGKKLLGNKRASKLFRLGLQQLAANQPEYFLVVSKKFITQGQHSKAFNLLRKQVYKENIEIEYKPIILQHYMHTCYKIMQKLIKSKAKELQANQEQQDRDPFSLIPNPIVNHQKKKSTLSRLDKINAIIEIQFQNIQNYEELICDLVQNYQTYSQQNGRKHQKLEPHNRNSFNSNFGSMPIESIDDFIVSETKLPNQSQYNQSMYNKEYQNAVEEDSKKTGQSKKHFDVYKIEAFKENYLQYFLKTILLIYKQNKNQN